jgi:hypothetical protein
LKQPVEWRFSKLAPWPAKQRDVQMSIQRVIVRRMLKKTEWPGIATAVGISLTLRPCFSTLAAVANRGAEAANQSTAAMAAASCSIDPI